MTGVDVLRQAVTTGQEALKNDAGVMTTSQTPGGKDSYSVYQAGCVSNSVSSTNIITVNNISDRGTLTNTGNNADFGIEGGVGFFVATDSADDTNYNLTNRTLTHLDNNDYLRNIDGKYLIGYKVDSANGVVSATPTAINFAGVDNVSIATQEIYIDGNVDARSKVLHGVSTDIRFSYSTSSENGGIDSMTEVIIPDSSSSGQIRIGDTFSPRVGTNPTMTTTFGGVSTSISISRQGVGAPCRDANGNIGPSSTTPPGIYGASDPNSPFQTGANGLSDGDGITIKTSNKQYSFVFNSNPEPSRGQFNSFSTLSQSINLCAKGVLSSRISSDDRLCIGLVDASGTMTFTDKVSTKNVVDAFQLKDISTSDSTRWCTLSGLAKIIKDNDYFRVGEAGQANTVALQADSPTETVSYDASTVKDVAYEASMNNSTSSSVAVTSIGGAGGGATIAINDSYAIIDITGGLSAFGSTLVNGDVLYLAGMSANDATLPDGYYVAYNVGGDGVGKCRIERSTNATAAYAGAFTGVTVRRCEHVNAVQDLNTLRITHMSHGLNVGDIVHTTGLGTVIASGGATLGTVTDGDFLVTAVDDQSFSICIQTQLAGGAANVIPSTQSFSFEKGIGMPLNDLNITALAYNAGAAQLTIASHGYANGDTISLAGIGVVADGGYDMYLSNGQYTVTVVDANNITIAPCKVHVATGSAPAFVASTSTTSTKILDATNAFNGAIETVANSSSGKPQIKIYIPNNEFVTGDKVKFSGLYGGLAVTHDGAVINEDVAYEIIQVDDGTPTGGVSTPYIIIEVDPDTPNATPAGSTFTTAAFNNVTSNVRLEKIGLLLREMNIGQELNFDATYSSTTGVNTELADDNVVKAMPIWQTNVIDSLGSIHTLKLQFIHMPNKQWGVQFICPENSDGTYDVMGTSSGVIASGTISFNSDGSFGGINGVLQSPVQISWSNGASPTSLTLNFGAEDSVINNIYSKGIKQLANPTAGMVLNDGAAPSKMVSFKPEADGTIVGTFADGKSRALWQITAGMVSSPNNLTMKSGGLFTANNATGNLTLTVFGGAAGNIVAGAYESSNVDSMKSMMRIIQNSQYIQYNMKGLSKLLSLEDTILNLM